MLALMVAAIMILASVAKLGFIADLISKPTMIGYMNGLALTILIGQLPKLLGFKVEADGLIGECVGFVRGLADGAAVPAAAAVGVGGIVVLLVLQRFLPKIPAVLVMVVLAIAAATVLDLAARGVSLVGKLPEGFPPFTLPDVRLDDLPLLLGGAVGIALVSLADTISNASAFAARTGQEIRGNQEMAGVGVANLAAGLFQGFPVSASGSRTAVAERAGARSQLTGVVGAALIVLMLVLVPGLFRNLPEAGPRRRGHHGVTVPGRRARDRTAVAAEPGGFPAVLRGVRRGGPARRAARDRDRRGPVRPQRLPARLVAVPHRARAGPGPGGLPRRPVPPAGPAAAGAGDLPVRRPALLRQRQDLPRRDQATGRPRTRGRSGSWSRRSP